MVLLASLSISFIAATSKPAEPVDKNAEDEDGDDVKATVGLKQRAVPFIVMLQRSEAEGADVVWGH